jgi:hypothetical protein
MCGMGMQKTLLHRQLRAVTNWKLALVSTARLS